jgi:hypothetical protein
MKKIVAMTALALSIASPAFAQTAPAAREPGSTGTVVQGQPNTTGNDRNVVSATGASTITTDSAACGNAGQPERAVPQGSASGSGTR